MFSTIFMNIEYFKYSVCLPHSMLENQRYKEYGHSLLLTAFIKIKNITTSIFIYLPPQFVQAITLTQP